MLQYDLLDWNKMMLELGRECSEPERLASMLVSAGLVLSGAFEAGELQCILDLTDQQMDEIQLLHSNLAC